MTAITPRDIIPIYLLISYLRRIKADNSNLKSELSIFVEKMLIDLNSFSVYDTTPPDGMTEKRFKEFIKYKTEARKATSQDSKNLDLIFILQNLQNNKHFYIKTRQDFTIESKKELFI